MLTLAPDRAVRRDAKPSHVIQDGGLEFRAAAGRVDVLDAEEEATPSLPRAPTGNDRGAGVPQVEEAGRARREARHDGVGLGHGGTAVALGP